MTPVDALDTLILMHLDAEATRAQSLIVRDLSFAAIFPSKTSRSRSACSVGFSPAIS